MNKIYLSLLAAICIFTSCRKDLDFEYRSIEPIYVIESSITNEGAMATITQTMDMMSSDDPEGVKGANVTITADDGTIYELTDNGDGTYTSDEAKGIGGHTYVMTANIGGLTTSSSSVMQDKLKLDSAYFAKIKMMGAEMFMFMADIITDRSDNNYYHLIMQRNGEYYGWSATDNHGSPKICELGIGCYYSKNEDHEEDIIHDGDTITAEIRRINKKTYDYLETAFLGIRNGYNPTPNFTNGVLGYFSAHYVKHVPTIIYNEKSVKELREK